MRVTPALAREWMRTRNTKPHRDIQWEGVANLKAAYRGGKFPSPGPGSPVIVFASNAEGGGLVDGQHRLMALAEMPADFEGVDMWVLDQPSKSDAACFVARALAMQMGDPAAFHALLPRAESIARTQPNDAREIALRQTARAVEAEGLASASGRALASFLSERLLGQGGLVDLAWAARHIRPY
jgi:hypothetical protein